LRVERLLKLFTDMMAFLMDTNILAN
jgi:hypothetical protein